MNERKLNLLRNILAKFLVALMVIMAVAVTAPGEAKAATAAPKLNKTSLNLTAGKKFNLNIGNKVKNSTYQWSSSNANVASVDNRGFVKGKTIGNADIYCSIKAPNKSYKLICKVAVLKGATSFTITNKVSALNVGQTYDLNRKLTPSSSNDKTTWKSSDVTIASPDKYGVFTALKAGTVTITGTTVSGKSDSVTIKVVDKDGTVTNQKELEALLGSSVALVTIKTTDAVNLTIPAGNYSKQKLVVDAPNADITNSGKFASIEIKQIKSNTWYEKAEGNSLIVSAADARVVVSPEAKVSIEVNESGAKIKIENNGVVKELVVSKDADINISGTSKQDVPVSVTVPNIKITSSVPLALDCAAKAEVVLLKGAETTTIKAATKEVIPAITGNVTIKVTVGTGTAATEETVTGTPVSNNTSGNTGTVTTPVQGTVTVTKNGDATTYTLSDSYKNLSGITVNYGLVSASVTSDTLTTLKNLLGKQEDTITNWRNITTKTKTIQGQNVEIKATADPMTKTVTFKSGVLTNQTYAVTVTVNSSDVSITVHSNQSGANYTITKGSDDKSLTIRGTLSGLTFTPYF